MTRWLVAHKVAWLTMFAMILAASIGRGEDYLWTDNFYIDGSAGWERPFGEDSTGFGSLGFNWGFPLPGKPLNLDWGGQLGGDVKFRDNNPDFDVTTGVFARNLTTPWTGDRRFAIASLFDYRHTALGGDLFAFRPLIGMTLNERDAIVAEGSVQISYDSETIFSQRVTDRALLYWNRKWNERLDTELGAGFQFGIVGETAFSAQAAYFIAPQVSISVGGELNTSGHYAGGVSVSYSFGQSTSHPTIRNVTGSGASAYAPFPKRSFPAMLHDTSGITDTGDGNGNGNGDNGDGPDGESRHVIICHRPPGNPGNARTIRISRNALPAHLAHGDTIGPCP